MSRSVGAAPVPDIDGLRRAALQASWRRDRRVAQRRMAMRWAAWYAIRGLPLLAIAAAVWFWVLPRLADSPLAPFNAPAQEVGPTSIRSVAPVRPTDAVTPSQPAKPDPQLGDSGLQLRLDGPIPPTSLTPAMQVAPTQAVSVRAAANATVATESPSPQLKPDNWLHSQEP